MECANCKKSFGLFRHKHICPECNRILCSKCLVKGPDLYYLGYEKDYKCCQKCLLKLNFDTNPKYKKALDLQNKVLTIPQTYQGKIHIKENSEQKKITTAFFKEKEEAYKSLRTITTFQDCDIVFNVKQEREKRENGNYVYSVIRLSGIPALQKHINKKV